MTESKPASRRQWLLFVPFAAIVVLAVAWSGFWYFAADRAEGIISAWIEQEARAGRVYACASRSIGGYPFRFEVRCGDPTMELAALQPPRTIKAKHLTAVAQVYQPNLIVAEITGPLSIIDPGNPATMRADWRLAQASLRGSGRRPERLSVVVDDLKVEQVDATVVETLGTANHVELHLRRSAEESEARLDVDFAAQIKAAVVSGGALGGGALGGRPIDVEATGVLRALPDLKPKPMPERLKEWQMAGGRLELTRLRLQQEDAIAVAAGTIGLSASGRPDGTFTITMAGFDRLVRDLVRGSGMQLGLIAGLSFLGQPAEIDGRRAVSVPLRITDGSARLGPIPLGKLDPLY